MISFMPSSNQAMIRKIYPSPVVSQYGIVANNPVDSLLTSAIAAIIILIYLLALTSATETWENTTVEASVASVGFKMILISSIVICVPGLCEAFFDYISGVSSTFSNHNVPERLTYFFLLLFPGTVYLIVRSIYPGYVYHLKLFQLLNYTVFAMLPLPIVSLLCKRLPNYFSPILMTVASILSASGLIYRGVYFDSSMVTLITILQYSGYGIVFLAATVFWRNIFLKWHGSERGIMSLTTEDLECAFITLISLVYIATTAVFVAVLNERYYADYTALHLGGIVTIQMFYTLLFTLVSGRVTEYALKVSYRDLALKRTFVRHVSHEIRTPLNIVLVGIDLIQRQAVKLSLTQPDAADQTPELVDEVRDSCKVAISILDDLLAYEKLDAGLFVLERERVNIGQFLRDSAALFRLQLLGKELTLNLLTDSNPQLCNEALIDIDPPKMTQVMRNFISNAIKFTPVGGRIDIDAALLTAGNASQTVLIKVRDSGAGVAKENVGRIFNEVVQFNANQLQAGGGSGLGLFISRGIVELHGGKVSAQSEGLGQGCTFTMELPVYHTEASTVEPGADNRPPLLSMTSMRGLSRLRSFKIMEPLCVLVVDDSHMNRKMVGRLLTSLGHTFEEADDGAVCVDKVKASASAGEGRCFDAVLIDHQMPMSGPEATRRLRSLGFEGAVIGITGNCAQEDLDEFRQAGADAVLRKPVNGTDIEQALRAHCKIKRND